MRVLELLTIIGDWVNDLKHGKGTESVKGVFQYDGDFMDGVKHGQGILSEVESGDTYNGDFENGQLHVIIDSNVYGGDRANVRWSTVREIGIGGKSRLQSSRLRDMGGVSTYGRMVVSMRESIIMIQRVGRGCLSGN